jgi:2-methylisocitrate lyase-like PEP mutase family enzyme
MDKVTTQLRKLINGSELVIQPGIFDGYSARLVQQAGYPSGFISGAGIAEALLGQPDIGLMGFELNLNAVRMIAACVNIPLLADADTGYGNAINVFHLVRAFEQAGLAGVMIEDQTWPKRCGHMAGKAVISAEEMVEKIHAAVEARRDADFVIKSRTDSLATHGIAEVVKRLNRYAEAGADLLFADALLSEQDIATVIQNVSKPLCINMGFGIRRRVTTPLISPMRLAELGVRVVIYPRLLTSCAIKGMQNGLAALEQATSSKAPIERPELLLSFEELNTLVGFDEFQALERKLAGG